MSDHASNSLDLDVKQFQNSHEMLNFMYTFGLTGNIVCPTWYKIIRWKFSKKTPLGKPHLEAITLVSEIFYWYRPKIEKNIEGNIKLVKKFSADILQMSYADIEKNLGQTKEEASSAFKTLENLGIAKREFRTIVYNGVKIPNVMFVRFFAKNLKDLMQKFLKANSEGSGESFQKKIPNTTKVSGSYEHDKNGELSRKEKVAEKANEKLKKFIPLPVQTGNTPPLHRGDKYRDFFRDFFRKTN